MIKFLTFALLLLVAAWAPTPSLAQQNAAAVVSQPGKADYVLGAGDVIRITVFQSPELTLDTRVPESGVISYPLLGSVNIGGLTIAQAERRLAEGLLQGKFLRNPQVSILITQLRGSQASVLGHAVRPGRYPLELTNTRLSDLMALAGGVAPDGSDQLVVVGKRNGKPFRAEIEFSKLFRGGSDQDIVMQNDDVVYVERAAQIYIYGEVQRPGALRLERGMTLLQALAAGGGLTPRGTQRGIKVHRKDADGAVQELSPTMQDTLQAGDVIYVRESLF